MCHESSKYDYLGNYHDYAFEHFVSPTQWYMCFLTLCEVVENTLSIKGGALPTICNII